MKSAAIGAFALFLAAPVLGQGAPPAPPAPPAPGPTLGAAWLGAQAAIAACLPENVTVTVLDSEGVERLIARSDGARSRGPDMSRRKANTALTFGRPSIETRDAAKTDTALAQRLSSDPKLIGFGGGLPILRDGKPFGAIAVAGGSSQELDHKCAAAGLAALQAG